MEDLVMVWDSKLDIREEDMEDEEEVMLLKAEVMEHKAEGEAMANMEWEHVGTAAALII